MLKPTIMQIHLTRTTGFSQGISKLLSPASLTPEELLSLHTSTTKRIKIKKNSVLYYSGSPLHSLYEVHTGTFKIALTSLNGYELITDFKMPNDMIGLEAIATRLHNCTATALEDSELNSINFSRLEKLANSIPSLQHNLNKILSCEIMRHHHTLIMTTSMSAERRFASFIYDLSQRHTALGYSPTNFVLKMRREDIASHLALRLETICRCITRISHQRVVEITGRDVTILNMTALSALIGANQ